MYNRCQMSQFSDSPRVHQVVQLENEQVPLVSASHSLGAGDPN
ncbi:hypothetical protein RBWH47_05974 [Rhodopirellula baltica WH47]|uniref:Uncharacterized protein n=1 Tax=Rhodopirellula baltica WH47 TaxID=991778 RepID=F2ALB9_RHOBT|nr:hypothetical protein RBWH47_05974 [Rhodopirellula baltica WH47]